MVIKLNLQSRNRILQGCKPRRRIMGRHTDQERLRIIKGIESSGLTIAQACKTYNICEASYYRWKKKYSHKNDQAQTKDKKLSTEKTSQSTGDDKQTVVDKKQAKQKQQLTEEIEKIIVDLRKQYPYYGIVRISQHLQRFEGVYVAPTKVLKILEKHRLPVSEFYQARKPKKITRFERPYPNDLWTTDLMVYRLKGGQRFYFIGLLDDHSRYVLAHGVYKTGKVENIIQLFQKAVSLYGLPKEVLTDRGGQFHSWNGMTRFEELLANHGVKHIMTKPHNPCCNGKIESVHRNLQKELLKRKFLNNVDHAQQEIADYIQYYNHERPHQGIGGITPADRYFGLAKNIQSYSLNPHPKPRRLYLTGRIGQNIWRLEENIEGGCVLIMNRKPVQTWENVHNWPKAIQKLCGLGENYLKSNNL